MRINNRLLVSTLIIIFSVVVSAPLLYSQICRVSVGRDTDGDCRYMEVYEYDYVTKKPEFPGGDSKLIEYINKERHYPSGAYKKGVQGRVTCSFVVNTNGAISHVMVLKSVESSLDREAMRIFECMPKWQPGHLEGTTVPVRVIRSVSFRK